jgi:hypothetical protein
MTVPIRDAARVAISALLPELPAGASIIVLIEAECPTHGHSEWSFAHDPGLRPMQAVRLLNRAAARIGDTRWIDEPPIRRR